MPPIDTTHVHQTSLLLTSNEQSAALDRLSNFSFFVPNFLFWLAVFYVGISIGQQLLRRFSPVFRALPDEKQRTSIMHIFQLFLVSFILFPQVYYGHTVTVEGLFDPDSVGDVGEPPQWLDRTRSFQMFSGFAVLPLVCGYTVSLLFASPRAYIALHHLIVLFLYAAGTLNMAHCVGPDVHIMSVGYWLMYHISTEQLSFIPLILNRFRFSPRIVEVTFLISWTFQIVQRAVVHSLFLWIYITQFVERRVKLYWDYFWLVVLPPCMFVLLLSQVFVIRIHYSLWRRNRQRRIAAAGTNNSEPESEGLDAVALDGLKAGLSSPKTSATSEDFTASEMNTVVFSGDGSDAGSNLHDKNVGVGANDSLDAASVQVNEMGDDSSPPPSPPRRPRFNQMEFGIKVFLLVASVVSLAIAIEYIPSACEVVSIETQRVAVVGAGASGLAAAMALSRHSSYSVDVFESHPVVGGSCQTSYDPQNPDQPLELGVQVFGPDAVIFEALLNEIGHSSFSNPHYDIDVSSVIKNTTSFGAPHQYSLSDAASVTRRFRPSKVGQPFHSNTSSSYIDSVLQVERDAERFSDSLIRARALWSKKKLWQTTIGDMIEADGSYSREFTREYLPSFLSFLFSYQADYTGTPVAFLSALTSKISLPPTFGWVRHPEKGCSAYMEKFFRAVIDGAKNKMSVYFNTPVDKVRKVSGGRVRLNFNGTSRVYDAVVMTGTYRNWASMLSTDHSKVVSQLFGEVEYAETTSMPLNKTMLHPARTDNGCWQSMAYHAHIFDLSNTSLPNSPKGLPGFVQTYSPLVNRDALRQCSLDEPTASSLYMGNAGGSLSQAFTEAADNFALIGALGYLPDSCGSVSSTKQCRKWLQPTHDKAYFRAGTNLHKIQGRDNIWFAGADTTWNVHEHALASGFVVAHQMGVGFPLHHNVEARRSFYGQYLWQIYGIDRFGFTPPLAEQ